MPELRNSKRYNLEDRTLNYAKGIIDLVNVVPNTLANTEIIKQLVRSAGSVGANYIDANGSLGKQDFIMRLRICRKETKESKFWLNLITLNG
jgi:four helix bundle protein